MAVIGVGKAFRDQSRAADARRTHRTPRDQRTAADGELPALAESCHVCGRTDFVMATEEGPTCLACSDVVPAPNPERGLWTEGLIPLGGLLSALVVFGVVPIPAGSKRVGVWAVAYGMAMVAAAISLPSGARMTRSPSQRVRGVGFAVAGLSGAQLLGLVGLMAWVVARGLWA